MPATIARGRTRRSATGAHRPGIPREAQVEQRGRVELADGGAVRGLHSSAWISSTGWVSISACSDNSRFLFDNAARCRRRRRGSRSRHGTPRANAPPRGRARPANSPRRSRAMCSMPGGCRRGVGRRPAARRRPAASRASPSGTFSSCRDSAAPSSRSKRWYCARARAPRRFARTAWRAASSCTRVRTIAPAEGAARSSALPRCAWSPGPSGARRPSLRAARSSMKWRRCQAWSARSARRRTRRAAARPGAFLGQAQRTKPGRPTRAALKPGEQVVRAVRRSMKLPPRIRVLRQRRRTAAWRTTFCGRPDRSSATGVEPPVDEHQARRRDHSARPPGVRPESAPARFRMHRRHAAFQLRAAPGISACIARAGRPSRSGRRQAARSASSPSKTGRERVEQGVISNRRFRATRSFTQTRSRALPVPARVPVRRFRRCGCRPSTVHHVRLDVVEQALVVGDDDLEARSASRRVDAVGDGSSAHRCPGRCRFRRGSPAGSSTAIWKISLRFFSPPEKPTFTGG